MTITATKTYSPTSAITSFESFTFDDGATIRIAGGLICSQHGRHHCCHHKLAHEVIITAAFQKAAAQTPANDQVVEQSTEAAIEAADAFNADYEAWLDIQPECNPLPQDVGLTPAEYASDKPDWLESADVDDLPCFSSRS